MWFKLYYEEKFINLNNVVSIEFPKNNECRQVVTITYVNGKYDYEFAKKDRERLAEFLGHKLIKG